MESFKMPTLPAPNLQAEIKSSTEPNQTSLKINLKPQQNADAAVEPTTTVTADGIAAPAATCPYKEPSWSAKPLHTQNYKFEVLKSGQIIEIVEGLQEKSVWKFGRLPSNDVEMAHPTVSRFHAVLQYRPQMLTESETEAETGDKRDKHGNFGEGWYIYDLGSTHGTFLNKQRVPAKTYIRMKVGHMLRLGASTRSYILQGPTADEEPESELTVTELREQRQRQLEEQQQEEQRQTEAREREGISWGMGEDADEETDLSVNPYASTNNEEYFITDPKRTLRGFFEREGLDLEYKCDEMSMGTFVCRVELPIDDSNGKAIVTEVVNKGRKKECVVMCALEACRILDRHGVLRQANQEPLKRKPKKQDSDDEDDFWDRTGDVERKKARKSASAGDVALTYEDLLKQESTLLAEVQRNKDELAQHQHLQELEKSSEDNSLADVDLDSFMDKISSATGKRLDKTEIRKLRLEEQRLAAELSKLQRLKEIAKPLEFKFNQANKANTAEQLEADKFKAKHFPLIGKRKQFSKFRVATMPVVAQVKPTPQVEVEEDEILDAQEQNQDAKTSTGCLQAQTVDNNKISEATNVSLSATHAIREVEVTGMVVQVDETKAKPELEPEAEAASSKKRQRPRQRVRYSRVEAEMDELAAHEAIDKYAKWVPPENQSGDGMTELNKKFGY